MSQAHRTQVVRVALAWDFSPAGRGRALLVKRFGAWWLDLKPVNAQALYYQADLPALSRISVASPSFQMIQLLMARVLGLAWMATSPPIAYQLGASVGVTPNAGKKRVLV